MLNRSTLLIILLVICCIEVISQTYLAHFGNRNLAAFLYLLSGVSMATLPLWIKAQDFIAHHPSIFIRSIRAGIFAVLSIGVCYFGWKIIQSQPLDYKSADMLPIIKIMAERFLHGAQVYAPIPEIWEGIQPIYLPAMWLPYCLPVMAGADIRFINLAAILILIALVGGLYSRRTLNWREFLPYLPLAILLTYVFKIHNTLITLSEEPVVIVYYSLLGYALTTKHYKLQGIAIALCLMSRYTLAFWCATYIGYLFFFVSRKNALWAGGLAGGLSIFLLFITGGIREIDFFFSLRHSYLSELINPDRAWAIKSLVERNIGLARFMSYESLSILHKALFIGSILLPFVVITIYHLFLRNKVSFSLFLLCSCKICLLYFFNCNPMPYSYLFYTSTFFSIIILHYITSPLSCNLKNANQIAHT